MTKRRPIVERREVLAASSAAAADRARVRAAVRKQAEERMDAALTAVLEGASGDFLGFMLERGVDRMLRRIAAHRDGPYACSKAGVIANRVGDQLPRPATRVAAEAVFKTGVAE